MRIDEAQTSEQEHSARKRRRRNTTVFSNYVQDFAAQVGTKEGYVNVENGSYDPSESQHVWLKVVARLRKEVLNARDIHRADILARSQLRTLPTALAPPAPPAPPSIDCSLCKEHKSMVKTICAHFLCWECLCKWHKKWPLKKKPCPCCNTILSKSHVIFMDQKPDDDKICDASRTDRFAIDLISNLRPAETQPVYTETISSAPASVEKFNSYPLVATVQPIWSASLIAEPSYCPSPFFLDDVWPNLDLHGELSIGPNHSGNTSNTVELPSSSIKRLNSEESVPSQSHILSIDIGAESTVEAIQMCAKQGQELGGFSCNSNIAADSSQAFQSLNERDLDWLLDENICDWSLLEEMFPL